jgi:hypothetical protein
MPRVLWHLAHAQVTFMINESQASVFAALQECPPGSRNVYPTVGVYAWQ